MRKLMAIVLAAILVLDVLSLGIIFYSRAKDVSDGVEAVTEVDDTVYSRATVTAVGSDIIQTDILNQASKVRSTTSDYDFSAVYEKVADKVAKSDISIVTQESVISSDHVVSGGSILNSPPEIGDQLINMGFDVINIATGHILDLGEEGLFNTLDYWNTKCEENENLRVLGAFADKTKDDWLYYNEVNGIRIGYVSFTSTTNGNSLPMGSQGEVCLAENENWLQARVTYADRKCDVVIVLANWGADYDNEVSETQKALAQKLSDWGADVIIGTNPNELEPVEYITSAEGDKTLVAYSLGNFVSTQAKAEYMLGGMLSFEIVKNNENKVVTLESVTVDGLVTHFGKNHSKVRVYMLSDYTEELASSHGIKETADNFSLKYLKNLLASKINSQFISQD